MSHLESCYPSCAHMYTQGFNSEMPTTGRAVPTHPQHVVSPTLVAAQLWERLSVTLGELSCEAAVGHTVPSPAEVRPLHSAPCRLAPGETAVSQHQWGHSLPWKKVHTPRQREPPRTDRGPVGHRVATAVIGQSVLLVEVGFQERHNRLVQRLGPVCRRQAGAQPWFRFLPEACLA